MSDTYYLESQIRDAQSGVWRVQDKVTTLELNCADYRRRIGDLECLVDTLRQKIRALEDAKAERGK